MPRYAAPLATLPSSAKTRGQRRYRCLEVHRASHGLGLDLIQPRIRTRRLGFHEVVEIVEVGA
jgi:hypothetical protein